MGRIRIIAGEQRGRRIDVPDLPSLRPTADRVREALFDILGPAVVGARVLDAYAGTGALGFEALSRGAAEVLFVECDRSAAAGIRSNADRLGLADRSRLWAGRVEDLLRRSPPEAPFDLLFADPPYRTSDVAPFLEAAEPVVARNGIVIVERERGSPTVERAGDLVWKRSESYGRCRLDFYARRDPEGAEPPPG